ncbi:MAG: TonB-dependent siderophore receptor [Vibrio sp.]
MDNRRSSGNFSIPHKTHRSDKYHHYKKSLLAACISAIIFPTFAHADTQQKDAHRVNTVTVYGQALDDDSESVVAKELWVGGKVATSILDTPASVSVITEKEMSRRDVSTTEEVLQYSPGVISDYYGSDDRNDYFLIRGFQATTYRDGMTNGSMRGVREDPYAFERVEVIRGANSTLFGPADPGGSVNFVSKKPKFESFGSGYVGGGSYDQKEAGLDFGNVINEDETLAFRFTGKVKDGDREYDHSQDDSQFFMGGLTWEPTDFTTASLIVDYLNQDNTPNSGGYALDKEYDREDFYGEPDYNDHNVERTNVTALVTHDFNNGFTLRGNARYSHLTDDFGYIYLSDNASRVGTEVDRWFFGSNTESDQFITNLMLQYDASFERIDSNTVVGVEYSDSSTEDESFSGQTTSIDLANPIYTGAPTGLSPYDGNEQDNTMTSVFLQQNFSLDDRYILSLGVRNDYIDMENKDMAGVRTSDDFNETSYRSAFTYKITPEVSTYVSYVESVSPPTIGTTPETGKQTEVGIKYAPASMNALFTAAAYQLDKEDVTIAVVQDSGAIERETMGKQRVKGIDLEAKTELFENFDLTAAYSYMDTEVREGTLRNGAVLNGNEFVTVPKNSASLWGNYAMLNDDLNVGVGVRYVGSYYFDAQNTSKSDDATLYDASLSYQITKAAGVQVNVHNIFDEQHVVGSGTADYYNPGREFSVNLHYDW